MLLCTFFYMSYLSSRCLAYQLLHAMMDEQTKNTCVIWVNAMLTGLSSIFAIVVSASLGHWMISKPSSSSVDPKNLTKASLFGYFEKNVFLSAGHGFMSLMSVVSQTLSKHFFGSCVFCWKRISIKHNNIDLKDIINPYNCLLKKANFSIKTSNE